MQAENLGPSQISFEHEISVDHTVHGIESEKKRSPGDRRSDPQIEDEVPEPQGLLQVNEQDHRSDH